MKSKLLYDRGLNSWLLDNGKNIFDIANGGAVVPGTDVHEVFIQRSDMSKGRQGQTGILVQPMNCVLVSNTQNLQMSDADNRQLAMALCIWYGSKAIKKSPFNLVEREEAIKKGAELIQEWIDSLNLKTKLSVASFL